MPRLDLGIDLSGFCSAADKIEYVSRALMGVEPGLATAESITALRAAARQIVSLIGGGILSFAFPIGAVGQAIIYIFVRSTGVCRT